MALSMSTRWQCTVVEVVEVVNQSGRYRAARAERGFPPNDVVGVNSSTHTTLSANVSKIQQMVSTQVHTLLSAMHWRRQWLSSTQVNWTKLYNTNTGLVKVENHQKL